MIQAPRCELSVGLGREVGARGGRPIRKVHGILAASKVGRAGLGHFHPRLINGHVLVVHAADVAQV